MDRIFRGRGGNIFQDSVEHLELTARILRIKPELWLRSIRTYLKLLPGGPVSVDSRLDTLREAYTTAVPEAFPLLRITQSQTCPACLDTSVVPRYSRQLSPVPTHAPGGYIYGMCSKCEHGVLISGQASASIYSAPGYFHAQSKSGAGYREYQAEQWYRIEKGRRLLRSIFEITVRPPRNMLEVGCGFAFTRFAAEELGAATMGVDLNPWAAEAASRLFGMKTFVGTLGAAVELGSVRRGAWDMVLYDFVLEHIADPDAELRLAAELLAPGGVLVLVVPNMSAVEVEVFGGTYRSFRSDHLHLFSSDSLALLLGRANLEVVTSKTGCTVHLLRGFLTENELLNLYGRGKGPDLTIVAKHRG